MRYIEVNNTEIVQVIDTFVQDPELTENNHVVSSDFAGVASIDLVQHYYWINSQITKKPTQPGSYYDWVGQEWVLDSARLYVEIKRLRVNKLFSCDWTQLPDSSLSSEKKAEWATYRQALRDFPSNNPNLTSTNDIPWPAEPS